MTRQRLWFGSVAGAVFVVDQLTKTWVRSTLDGCTLSPGQSCATSDLPGPVDLLHTNNAGSALGFSQGLVVWTVLAGLALMLLPPIASRGGKWGLLGAALLAGGALGNLADRVRLGGVTDFLDVGVVVINFADVSLLIGVIISTTALVLAHRARVVQQSFSH